MNIAIIAHDAKKELMVQFCIAYCRVLSQHSLVATGTTGKLVAEATGLPLSLIHISWFSYSTLKHSSNPKLLIFQKVVHTKHAECF